MIIDLIDYRPLTELTRSLIAASIQDSGLDLRRVADWSGMPLAVIESIAVPHLSSRRPTPVIRLSDLYALADALDIDPGIWLREVEAARLELQRAR